MQSVACMRVLGRVLGSWTREGPMCRGKQHRKRRCTMRGRRRTAAPWHGLSCAQYIGRMLTSWGVCRKAIFSLGTHAALTSSPPAPPSFGLGRSGLGRGGLSGGGGSGGGGAGRRRRAGGRRGRGRRPSARDGGCGRQLPAAFHHLGHVEVSEALGEEVCREDHVAVEHQDVIAAAVALQQQAAVDVAGWVAHRGIACERREGAA